MGQRFFDGKISHIVIYFYQMFIVIIYYVAKILRCKNIAKAVGRIKSMINNIYNDNFHVNCFCKNKKTIPFENGFSKIL